ncbi:MAG: hypothetical protein JWO38_3446 [Gemmataceae bacterium]|nr:hypothetical protein [Gemmataceae bacterium]
MPVLRCRPAIAMTTSLAALALSLGLAHAISSDWVGELGLDVWNLPEQTRIIDRENARYERLAIDGDCLREQIAASGEVVAGLTAGRARLATAAEELEAINRDRAGMMLVLEYNFPDASTDQQRLARWAIEEVRRRLQDDPSRQAEVVERLEGEFETMCQADGRATARSRTADPTATPRPATAAPGLPGEPH